jgi:hypothetical protein
VRGLDIGCGANFIYCLLGACLHGWHMTGVDVTEVAQQWAQRNVHANPQLAHLLEVRLVEGQQQQEQQQPEGQQAQEEVRAGVGLRRWACAAGPWPAWCSSPCGLCGPQPPRLPAAAGPGK